MANRAYETQTYSTVHVLAYPWLRQRKRDWYVPTEEGAPLPSRCILHAVTCRQHFDADPHRRGRPQARRRAPVGSFGLRGSRQGEQAKDHPPSKVRAPIDMRLVLGARQERDIDM